MFKQEASSKANRGEHGGPVKMLLADEGHAVLDASETMGKECLSIRNNRCDAKVVHPYLFVALHGASLLLCRLEWGSLDTATCSTSLCEGTLSGWFPGKLREKPPFPFGTQRPSAVAGAA